MNSDGNEPVDFVAKLEELRAKKAALLPKQPEQPVWKTDDLLPDLGGPILTDADKEFDSFVDSIDIIDAYNKFCGKMTPVTGGKREGIKISCPNPAHPDKDPSAWINLDKQTWYCGGCEEGGDAHDIAAYNLGYPVPAYKQGESFHKLREQMAAQFGFHVKKVMGTTITWQEEVKQPEPDFPVLPVLPHAPGTEDTTPDNVSHMWAEDPGEPEIIYPTINWQGLVREDTFVYQYMKECSKDDSPEEYHFWHALLALGLVVGRKVTLDDTKPVYGNMLVCMLGATGTGKSRSRGHLDKVLKATSPYRPDGSQAVGVKIIPIPGSGEYLVSQFCYEGKDPSGKTSLGYQSVTGIVDFDELSALIARSGRTGSSLGPTIMSFADAKHEVTIGGLTRGDYIAADPFCSITASTQPKAIRNLLSRNDTASGFLNRWIFVGGKQKETESIGGRRSGTLIDLEPAITELKAVRGWGAFERSVLMDDDAYERYDQFFRAKIDPTKRGDDTDLLKRVDLIAKKIMLLLTINLRLESVPLQVVEAMITLFDYVVECYGILNENIGATIQHEIMSEIQRHVLRHLEKTGRGCSARDLVSYTRRRNYGLDQIKKALETMVALDLIEIEEPTSKMGRPTIRYRVVV